MTREQLIAGLTILPEGAKIVVCEENGEWNKDRPVAYLEKGRNDEGQIQYRITGLDRG
jgi:hypothetical protein